MPTSQNPPFKTGQEVRITCLNRSGVSIHGKLNNRAAPNVGLSLHEALPVGALVRVEWGAAWLLGEVIHCRHAGDAFVADFKVEHVVHRAELAEMRRIAVGLDYDS